MWRKGLHYLGAICLLGGLCFWSLWRLTSRAGWESIGRYHEVFLQGWMTTVVLSLAALAVSGVFGVLLALAGRAPVLPVRALARIYVEVIRGTPLLVQILLLYYGVFDQVGITNRYVAGVLILSGFSSAYISEIVRGGIESVGKSQLESARAIGLTTWQTYRHVIFPQAIRQILPALAGQFASLIKDSSLLSIIGISELTQNAQNVAGYTFSSMESYVPLAAGYMVLTLPISLWAQGLERRVRYDT